MNRCSSRSAMTASRIFADDAARSRRRRAIQQQLGHLLRDRRAALDDAPSTRLVLSARTIAIGSTPTCRQKRRSSAATVAATSVGGKRVGASAASRASARSTAPRAAARRVGRRRRGRAATARRAARRQRIRARSQHAAVERDHASVSERQQARRIEANVAHDHRLPLHFDRPSSPSGRTPPARTSLPPAPAPSGTSRPSSRGRRS